jgi:hypothetical protein
MIQSRKLLLLGIILLFFIILITYEIVEGFAQPKAVSTSVRENNTCSDPDMEYIYDRFDRATIKDPTKACDTGFSTSNYFGLTYCLPNCRTGYTPFSNDTSFCIRTDGKCSLSKDLSNTIETNWAQVCGPLYKTNINLLSTMGSISTVISTINNQYTTVNTNYLSFSNLINSYSGSDSTRLMLRNNVFNTVVTSNYLDLTNLRENINSNFIMMSNKKDRFNLIYNSFDCANYM